MKKIFLNKGEDHQHFGLRKLSIGVASVLLGTTFLAYNSETIHADTTNNINGTSQQVSNDGNVDTIENKSDVNSRLKDDKSETNNIPNNELSVSEKKQDDSIGSVNNQVQNSNSDQKVQSQSSDPSNTEYLEATGLPQFELSDDQLAKLGLDKDTYLRDGVKYRAVGNLVLDIYGKGKVPVNNVRPPHTESGDLMPNSEVYNKVMQYMEDNYNPDIDVESVSYTARLAPYIQGGTLYINKGHVLDSTDARRGLPDEYANGYENVKWDNQVDTNKAKNYDAVIDVTYKNNLGVSTSAHVVVVDLKGKTIYGSASDDGESIDTDPVALITGQPEGSTNIHWITPPTDIDKVGVHPGEIQVTYPDGNTGTATVTYITSNPKWITPTPTTPEGKLPAPKDVITINPGDPTVIPDTKVTWTNGEPDVSNPGTIDTSVTVTYPDGHKTVVPGQIIVVGNKAIIETKEVTRVIIDNVPNQDPIKENQTVTFTREVTKDDKGNVIKATDWKVDGPAAWDAYQAHGAAGYTANPASIPAMAVNPDTKSTRVEINYTKNTSSTPDQPTNPSTPQPTDPSQPTSPSAPQPSAPVDNNDNEPAPAPHASAKPSNPVKKNAHKKDNHNHKKTVTTPLNGGEKGNGSHSSGDVRPLATKANGYASKDNKRALTAANKITGRKSALPQTGEKQNGFVVAVGAAIATVGSLFGLASRKKRY